MTTRKPSSTLAPSPKRVATSDDFVLGFDKRKGEVIIGSLPDVEVKHRVSVPAAEVGQMEQYQPWPGPTVSAMDKKIPITKGDTKRSRSVRARTLSMISFGTAPDGDITVKELGSKLHAALGSAGNLAKGCEEILASVDIADGATKEALSTAIINLRQCEAAFEPFRVALLTPP